jgi:hypothetical protein
LLGNFDLTVIDRVRRTHGLDKVEVYSEERIKITWNNTWLIVDCKLGEFSIHAPIDLDDTNSFSWNQSLENFHTEVIEPIKDQIGGVATGIGFKTDEAN